jgi:hypothetical protein
VKSASAYWVKVERSIEPWKFIHATAEVVGPNCIRLDTDNVSVITLSPGKALVDSSQPIKVTWNDVAYTVKLDNNRKATLKNASYTPSQLEKKPLLEGPINDVITTPFAFVTGTISSDPLMLAYCESYTKALVDDWKVWQHATPRYFKDTEISEQDLKQYSLILIGGPDANLISKRFSKQIPLELKSDAVVIDGNSIPAKDAAVCMIYPHPLNSDRYVMINAATSAQGMSYLPGLRHNMYSYDFAISDGCYPRWEEGRPEEKVLAAGGFFDPSWRLKMSNVQLGDPEIRSRCPIQKAPDVVSPESNQNTFQLSRLLPVKTEGNFGGLFRGLNYHGQPMVLDGKTYSDGISTSTWGKPNEITYDISKGNWKYLRSTIGIEQMPEDKSTQLLRDNVNVVFVVKGDDKELYRSKAFKWGSKPETIEVEISGIKQLRLEVESSQDDNGVASVDWAELRLER